jgi:hypothetical protein
MPPHRSFRRTAWGHSRRNGYVQCYGSHGAAVSPAERPPVLTAGCLWRHSYNRSHQSCDESNRAELSHT